VRESKQSARLRTGFGNLEYMRFTFCQKFAPYLVAGLILAASASHAQQPPAANPSVAVAPATSTAEAGQLTHDIRHQLHVLPYYSVFDYITFTLDGGKVTLTGYVLRPTLRADAEAAVKSLVGVYSVKNLIEVLPKSPTDDDFRRAVYRSIFEDSTLQRYAVSEVPVIHIILRNGEVTLEGSVATEAERSLTSTRASSVSGITTVKNNISIRPQGAPAN
jgi:hyperosmotically inducible protein